MEGKLHELDLKQVLTRLASEGETGILTVQGPGNIVSLSFLDGQLVSGDALNRSLEDGIGAVLAKRGQLDASTYSGLLVEHQAGGGRVLDLLTERSYVTEEQLHEALREHVLSLTLEVVEWTKGEFKFYRGEEITYEAGMQPVAVEEILVRAASKVVGEEESSPYPEESVVLSLAGDSEQEEGIAELGEESRSLLAMVDGQRSVGEIAQAAGVSVFQARYHLGHLLDEGLLRAVALPPREDPGEEREGEEEVEAEPPSEDTDGEALAQKPVKPALGDRLRRRVPVLDSEEWFDIGRRVLLGTIGGLLVLLAAMSFFRGPVEALLPLSWQSELRREWQDVQRKVRFQRLDEAAKTIHLLEGRFPESLGEMVGRGLLTSDDVAGDAEAALAYSSNSVRYEAGFSSGVALAPSAASAGSIFGNFLLDPEFVIARIDEIPPLVLLD